MTTDDGNDRDGFFSELVAQLADVRLGLARMAHHVTAGCKTFGNG